MKHSQQPQPKATTYDVDVIGYIWQGQQSSYSYRIKSPDIPTHRIVKSAAGDFEYVDDFRVSTTTTTRVQTQHGASTMIVHDIVKDWTDPASVELFNSMQE